MKLKLTAKFTICRIFKTKIKIIALSKEGLGLINGTQFMAAFGSFGLYRMHHLLEQADIIAALTIEAACGSIKPFDAPS